MWLKRLTLLCAIVLPAAAADLRPDVLLADFEGSDYGAWKAEGDAFGAGPARGTLANQMPVSGFKGKGLVNSYLGGDGSTGTLTSPPFEIQRRFLNFLIGGGGYTNETFLELLVDGKPVRSATGPNTQPGGSERLEWRSWDLAGLEGRQASLRIVDHRTEGWGHINVDDILLSDKAPPQVRTNAQREFTIAKRYLNIPIRNGAPSRKVTLLAEGRVQVVNDIELADAEPDWWAFMEVEAWRGKTVTLQVDRLEEDSRALGGIEQSDSIRDAENLYREPLRGQFHFSSRRGWNNDPNGLVFYDGEYHLFYQHNPYGWNWGNMHWGHAVSRDLVRWTESGDVLAPDTLGPMFSGSAVVDWNNTSGLGRPGQPPLVLVYTAAGNPTVQCMASSTDGRTFAKFPRNPVLGEVTGGNRDPKVVWHEPTRRWIMTLYVGLPGDRHTIHFYRSTNLREWSLASITEGGTGNDHYLFECPDFFELPVDGDPAHKKWVLSAANSEYSLGTFDGITFKPETSKLPGQLGRGFYAAQTFSDIPPRDGRRIQIGWLQTPTPGMSFNQSMSIPMELRLTNTANGPRLTRTPVRELDSLRGAAHRFGPLRLEPGAANPLANVAAELIELRADFEPGQAETTFTVRGATLTYDPGKQELTVNGHRVPAPLRDGRQRLTVYCDRTALEIFASDGLVYVPFPFTPKTGDHGVSVQARSGSITFRTLEMHELRSAWTRD